MKVPAEPSPSESLFRDAMSRFASGVTLVTTRDEEGRPHGFTASSFTSLSINPPLILVCMGNRAAAYPVFLRASRFAVSILADDQVQLAKLFSTRGADRFGDPAIIDGPGGLPVAAGALVHLDCAIDAIHPGGDHAVLIGRPQHIDLTPGKPLIHYDRGLRGLE